MKKTKILFILVLVILLLGLGYQVYGKYVLSKTIKIPFTTSWSTEVSITTTKNDEKTATVSATATDNGAGVKKYDFYINNELKQTVTTSDLTASYSFDYASVFGTTYDTYVVVTDNNDATSKSNISTIVDYTISTRADLETFRDSVNNGNKYTGETITQTANIDLQGSESNQWTPIGNYKANTSLTFAGVYNGNYKTINNLYINTNDGTNGLFGQNSGCISNLLLENVNLKVAGSSGAICATNNGTISNCGTKSGQIIITSLEARTGGIVGTNCGIVQYCYNSATIKAEEYETNSRHIGGIVGFNGVESGLTGIVSNCYNTGAVIGDQYVGGVVGTVYTGSSVSKCYNIANIEGNLAFGSLIGTQHIEEEGNITYNYYLDGTSTVGLGFITATGPLTTDKEGRTEAKTSTYMKSSEFVSLLGESNWKIVAGVNSGYPILYWQQDEGRLVSVVTTKNDAQTATINAIAEDNGVEIKKYDFYINDELKHTATTSDLTASYSFDYASTFGTTYNTYVVVTDNNNATSQSNISTVADYTISTKEDLEAFRDSVNNCNYYQNETIIQTADIDLEGSETNQWIPIGENEYSSYFNGTYEGNNHSISGIYINNDKTWQGLFKNIYTNGIVKNINLENGIINANDRSAGIAAGNSGQIIGCVNSCNIEGDYAGQAGIVAVNDGRIVNCYNTGSIVGNITDTFFEDIGGIASINTENGVVEGCYNIGNISVNATNDVYTRGCDAGGIVGQNGGIIRNCYNMGNMDVSLIHRVGGITGWNRGGTVCNCYNANTVIRGVTVGGIVGDNTTEIAGTVTNTYYLEGTATGGINGADVTGQAEVRTSAIMKTTEFKDLLGDEKWKIVQGVNSGYPILWWQTDEPEKFVLADVVSVGDYVNYDANSNGTYTFTSSDCLVGSSVSATISSADKFNNSAPSQWRVLSVDKANGIVELMSADPTVQSLTLSGADGFGKAEIVLNNIGAIYGKGKGATEGRSIKEKDIEQYSSYDKTTYVNGFGAYGDTKSYYVSGNYYNEIKDEKGNVIGYQLATSSGSSVLMTQTYYAYTASNYFSNSTIYNMLFKNSTSISEYKPYYWLASRITALQTSAFVLNVASVRGGVVEPTSLFRNPDENWSVEYNVVPVVSLKSNIQTTGQDANGVWQLIVE